MKSYTFESLSGTEFENLSRDLLQEELGYILESFTAGRDQGIDGRWIGTGPGGDEHVIVQCKHYAKSGLRKLIAALAKERKKLGKLKPTRYILTTSVPLTPLNKDRIIKTLAPYCRCPGDIYGLDDLNNLLGRHEEVERRHFKLWLTSTAALAKLHTAPTFLDSEAAVMRMRERLKRYVPNDSFPRALRLLEDQRFCLIVGNPGIGKTTLAEALLVYHVNEGYQALRIMNHLSELNGLTDRDRKQIFYYDDFLGKTVLSKTEHNEDKRLIELLEEVAQTPNWRFVLTTRDYILNAACAQSEDLYHFPFDRATCTVRLEDYTRPIKARILYNHLYFSTLPAATKLALVDGERYKAIVAHPNYNPRVVEHMTDAKRLKGASADTYLREFMAALDDPLRVWAHAFKRHISHAARHVLLALFTLSDNALFEDLRRAFWALHDLRRKEYNWAASPDDFETALKELDGNFVITDRAFDVAVVRFQNPSVRDFLEQHLLESHADALDLVRTAGRTIQFRRLWGGRRNRYFPGVIDYIDEFVTRLAETIKRETELEDARRRERTPRRNNSSDQAISERAWQRLNLALDVRTCARGAAADSLVRVALNAFNRTLEAGDIGPEETGYVLDALRQGRIPQTPEQHVFLRQAKESLLIKPLELSDCVSASNFIRDFPEAVTWAECRQAAESFLEIVDFHVWGLSGRQRPAELRDLADQIEDVALMFGVDVTKAVGEIRSQADENEAKEKGAGPPELPLFRWLESVTENRKTNAEGQYVDVERDFASYGVELRTEIRNDNIRAGLST